MGLLSTGEVLVWGGDSEGVGVVLSLRIPRRDPRGGSWESPLLGDSVRGGHWGRLLDSQAGEQDLRQSAEGARCPGFSGAPTLCGVPLGSHGSIQRAELRSRC